MAEAIAYQVSKDIASMASVACGDVDSIIITGGMAYNEFLVDLIRKRVGFIAPVERYPGEDEMGALASGVLRILSGEEKSRQY
jgi:butyrate kinase